MASTKFIHDGNSVDYTPSANVSAGDVVLQETLVGIAKLDIPAGKLGALAVSGVFDVAKAIGPGTALVTGVKVYWHPIAQHIIPIDEGAVYMGKTVRDASDDDGFVRVRLEQ